MPKTLSNKRVYDSDDGFVEDGRKSKKPKNEPKPRNAEMQKDSEGNQYWEASAFPCRHLRSTSDRKQLSGKRRVQISDFKGNTMIGIREFYEKDGQMLPGKKGIAMTVEQYTAFLDLMPDIERVLKSKGIKVPRPPFDKQPVAAEEQAEDDESAEHAGEDEHPSSPEQKDRLDKFKLKKNHEATSSSDEG